MGFLHFENVTSHPVLLTFVRLLLARPSGFEPKWRKMKLSLKASVAQGEVHIAELGEKGSYITNAFYNVYRVYCNNPNLLNQRMLFKLSPRSFTLEKEIIDPHQKIQRSFFSGNAFWKDNQMSKKALARHRWHLVYTLMKNPQLQFLRRTTNDWLED